jgi:hypothetical protein
MKKTTKLPSLIINGFLIGGSFLTSCSNSQDEKFYKETMEEIDDAFERAKVQHEDNTPKESVRGDWTEDDLIAVGNIADAEVRNQGVVLNEGRGNICDCIVRSIENEFDGPNDPTMTESTMEPIITNCVDTYYVIDPGGC